MEATDSGKDKELGATISEAGTESSELWRNGNFAAAEHTSDLQSVQRRRSWCAAPSYCARHGCCGCRGCRTCYTGWTHPTHWAKLCLLRLLRPLHLVHGPILCAAGPTPPARNLWTITCLQPLTLKWCSCGCLFVQLLAI